MHKKQKDQKWKEPKLKASSGRKVDLDIIENYFLITIYTTLPVSVMSEDVVVEFVPLIAPEDFLISFNFVITPAGVLAALRSYFTNIEVPSPLATDIFFAVVSR